MSAVDAYLNSPTRSPTAGYEYIWQGGAGELRSKVRYLTLADPDEIMNETWNYDGSSTAQATTEASEVLLNPRRVYRKSNEYYYVLCESIFPDGTPAPGNTRTAFPAQAAEELGAWFGFEQEFFVEPIDPAEENRNTVVQGPFYCGTTATTPAFSRIRQLTEEIVAKARALGLGVTGWNLEVAPAQTEIQIFGPAFRACDDLTMLRYICHQTLLQYGQRPVFAPKPYPTLNGSGLHTNVSTTVTRETTDGIGLAVIHSLMSQLAARHDIHLASYGSGNEARLTGTHETSSLREFSYSVGGRHTSVRIPRSVAAAGGGYFEDRRPAANADPYAIGTVMIETLRQAIGSYSRRTHA
jgi:glutamine synthetase